MTAASPSSIGPTPGEVTADRVRQTAQWLTAGTGAGAAVLLGSLKLSDISRLHGQPLVLAGSGVALGLIGSFGAMLAWAQVLAPVTTMLVSVQVDGQYDSSESGWLSGFGSLNDIRKLYIAASVRRVNAIIALSEAKSDDQRTQATNELNLAKIQLDVSSHALARVLDYAGAAEMRRRWRRASWQFVVAVVVASVGIFLFAVQSPPSSPSTSGAKPAARSRSL